MGKQDFLEDALHRLMEGPAGLQAVLEGLAVLPSSVGVRLVRDLGAKASDDLLEALLFWPDADVHRAAAWALEKRRSVRALLALDHYARVAPESIGAGAAAERLAALQARGALRPWSATTTFQRALWKLPEADGGSSLVLAARAADGLRLLMARLAGDGTIADAVGRTLPIQPLDAWDRAEALPLSAVQAHSILMDAEGRTLRGGGRLPEALLAWQGLRWAAPHRTSVRLSAFARELKALVPFRAVYESGHKCADCSSLNGRRLTVLEPIDEDPLAGIACRVSVGSGRNLAPLAHLRVGERHPARRLLERYSHWCREHLLDR